MKNRPLWILGVFVLACVALVIPLPPQGRAMHNLLDALHGPLFAVLAGLLYHHWSERRGSRTAWVAAGCWLLVIALGTVSELLQTQVGRYASWQDVWADAWGGVAGIVGVWGMTGEGRGRRVVGVTISVLSLSIAMVRPAYALVDVAMQHWERPSLASFESSRELSRWRWQDCRVRRTREVATDGSWSLQVDLDRGRYPGIVMNHPLPDWSDYDQLLIDVRLTGSVPLNVVVKVEDAWHNHETEDRFQRKVRLAPGWNRIRVGLADVARAPRGRPMDMHHIAAVSLFTVNLLGPRTIYVDRMRLQ